MIYIGIDPGQSGGIAKISTGADGRMGDLTGDITLVAAMPKTEQDIWMLLADDPILAGRFAFIEKVHAMPKQGVSSTFKFGRNYGFLRACLIAAGIPFDEVSPVKWQRALGCLTKGDKNITKSKAQQLFPDMKFTHATADAMLLAEYCRRIKTNT